MSKKIKVPYEYSSQFFGNSKRFRWFEISVPDNVTYKTFIPDFVEHTATVAQILLAEKACARLWLSQWQKNPVPLSPSETMGLLTILDMGVAQVVATYGGDHSAYLNAVKSGETLSETESVILASAAIEKLEQENG